MSRPDALTYRTLEALAGIFEEITIANGYRTDIGTIVTLEDDYAAVALTGKPSLFIGSTDMPFTDAGRGRTLSEQTISVVIEFAQPAAVAGAYKQAHNGLQDIIDAFPMSSADLPDDVGKPSLTGASILRRPEGAEVIVAQATARVVLIQRKPVAQ